MGKKKLFLLIITLLIFFKVNCQVAPGQWRDHLNYTNSKKVLAVNDRIYCAGDQSLFYYDTRNNSLNKISKVNGLNDVEIADLDYSDKHKTLIIAYKNGNIDFIRNNKTDNIPQLKNKITISDKTINSLIINDDFVYFNCNFGILKVNIANKEIIDSWYPSSNGLNNKVYSSCIFNSIFYSSTEKGLFYASVDNEFLANYKFWNIDHSLSATDNTYKQIVNFNSKYLVVLNSTSGKVYTKQGANNWEELQIIDNETVSSISVSGNTLFATTVRRSVQFNDNLQQINNISIYLPQYTITSNNIFYSANISGLFIYNGTEQKTLAPNGPGFNSAYKIFPFNNKVWVTAGMIGQTWNMTWNNGGSAMFSNNNWHSYSIYDNDETNMVRDILTVCIDPRDDQHFFATSWSGIGVIEYKNNKFAHILDSKNSTLHSYLDDKNNSITQVFGSATDADGNFWFTNSSVSKPISVLDKDNKWHSFGFEKLNSNLLLFGQLYITSWGHKWTYILEGPNIKLLAFNDKGTFDDTSDDDYKIFSIVEIEGNSVSSDVLCMAEDKNGSIWVGTKEGPVVYYNPQDVFSTEIYASRIKVPVSKKSTDATILLEKARINGIAVDGANRKWIATGGAGVYYLSDDGTQELLHFNEENSPLLSNNVNDVGVDAVSGEVFFATDKGVISFRGYATDNFENFGKVYVYPNPVKPGYDGDIVITGLANNINVKITDISGNLVFETESLGGQAIWNGRNFRGAKANTGIYLVFCTNKDGSKTKITKFMVFK